MSRFETAQKTTMGFVVKCPAHADKSPSLSVSLGREGNVLVHCFAGCSTESICSSMGITIKDLFPDKPGSFQTPRVQPRPPAQPAPATTPAVRPTIDKIYQYHNALGKEAFQVVRLKPKSFRQRHIENGKWVWSMEGIERFLYRLPEVLKTQEVWVAEGEKDSDNLSRLGYCGTCNVGGAGKWLDGYTESLAGKDVVICGDTDKPGQEHAALVFDSVCGVAKTVRVIKLPSSVKDVSEFIATFSNDKEATAAIAELRDAAHPFIKGTKLPIYTMTEMEAGYQRHVNTLSETSFDLYKWLPSVGSALRPLVCGELVFIIGDTGIGKTGVLSSMAKAALPLPTLMFELELPPELLFERFVATSAKMTCREVEQAYTSGDSMADKLDSAFKNLFICTESKLTLDQIESYICRAELKMGTKPKVVLIDYIQLVQASGANRREKISDIAEGLKVLAKTTRTIVIVASQVRRPDGDDNELSLHSAKESGSIENSCGLMLGLWRDLEKPGVMHVKVLKSTKGGGGHHVQCEFDGARMTLKDFPRT